MHTPEYVMLAQFKASVGMQTLLEQHLLCAEAEGSAEGQWLHCLALAASLLERMPSKKAHLAGASGCITCLDDLSRLLIVPAMQHSLPTIRCLQPV